MQTYGGSWIRTLKQNYCQFFFFHFPLRVEKIYSAKLAESWLYHKNSLGAATVNVEYMNLDTDDIILWFLSVLR